MLFIIEDAKQNVTVTSCHSEAHDATIIEGCTVLDRHDYKSFDDAAFAAEIANRADDGEAYIATDGSASLYPRYDVVSIPKVGDSVSRGFNGDYYPVGKS